MSQFIKEFGIVDEKIQDQLFDIVLKDGSKFQTSQLYSSKKQEKFVDFEERSSQYRLITSSEAFDVAELLVRKINIMDEKTSYILFRNNITHISYKAGDFFKAHEDYLSITSNTLEEYTMIICMYADCEGGETLFHINEWFKYPSKSSITPKHCMLFRKDLRHEGLPLKSGMKNILTFNVWGIAKDANSIVAISFPRKDNDYDNINIPKFLISTNKIVGTNTLLESFLHFSLKDSKILIYEEKTWSKEKFQVIYKLYNKMYITVQEYKDCREIIWYYHFTINNMLIDFSGDANAPENESKTKIMKSINSIPKFDFKDSFLVCSTREEAIHVSEVIKAEHLPFINFTMILAEGSLTYGGGMSDVHPQTLDMCPMWVVFGDNNNILLKAPFVTKSTLETDLQKLKKNKDHNISLKIKNTMSRNIKFRNYDDEKENENENENGECTVIEYDQYFHNTLYFGLKVCETISQDEVFGRMITYDYDFIEVDYYKPTDIEFDENKKQKRQSKYYTITEDNKMIITPKHYKHILKKIKEVDLLSNVKSKIKSISFLLPQTKNSYEHNFCNEDVYGNANFLTVYGFLRLE